MMDELQWYGDEVEAKVTQGAVEGLNMAAQEVQQGAQRRSPVATGALQNSIQVALATPDHLESIVFSDSPYAVYQHELFSYRRRTGQPKYLESAAVSYERDFRQLVGKTIRDYVGSS